LFAEELSQCYAANGKIDLAMTEIITLLRTSFNLGVVQGKITALISNPNNIPVVEESLLKLKKTDQENLLNYRLIEWFYRSTNQTGKALNIVSELDKKSGSNGGEIYQFASVCSKDGLFEDALKAYSMIIDDNSAAANLRISAIFGYTRTLETKLSISTTITKEQISDVLQRYESIAKDPTASSFAPEIVYRKGMVLKIFAKDIPAAKKEFTQCASVYSSTQFASLSRLELAEIAIVEGSFEEAKNILKPMRVLSETNELRRKADFFIAEMLWFEGNIDSSKVLYGTIAKKVQTNEANDALERIILIEQFQDQKVRLQEYAKATYLTFQMKYNDALNAFRTIISSNATDDISELSFLDILLIQHSTNQDENVITTFTEFIKAFPESIWGDKALFLYASSLKKLQRFEESKKAFQQLLATYPSSTYLTATREELRKIPL
jgi:tetratricopeptide (TPR) repeat protein